MRSQNWAPTALAFDPLRETPASGHVYDIDLSEDAFANMHNLLAGEAGRTSPKLRRRGILGALDAMLFDFSNDTMPHRLSGFKTR
jgi:hypothetical protein